MMDKSVEKVRNIEPEVSRISTQNNLQAGQERPVAIAIVVLLPLCLSFILTIVRITRSQLHRYD